MRKGGETKEGEGKMEKEREKERVGGTKRERKGKRSNKTTN